MLCSSLMQTGITGNPAEFFNPPLLNQLYTIQRLGLGKDEEFIPKMFETITTQNGVAGLKLPAHHTGFFVEKIAEYMGLPVSTLYSAIDHIFPNVRYIFLTRNDKVAQAVSYFRANVTGEWTRYTDGVGKAAFVQFHHLGIETCLRRIERSNAYWESYFNLHGISPLRITYEELLGDFESVISRVHRLLNLPIDTPSLLPTTIRMGDSKSKEWAEEFRRLGRIDLPQIPQTDIWAKF